jgi:hypothetical protein
MDPIDPETICDLPMMRATYRRIEPRPPRAPFHGFRIQFGQARVQIDIDEVMANEFATQLEILAARFRVRLLEPLNRK